MNLAGSKPAIFMSHVLQKIPVCLQWLPIAHGALRAT